MKSNINGNILPVAAPWLIKLVVASTTKPIPNKPKILILGGIVFDFFILWYMVKDNPNNMDEAIILIIQILPNFVDIASKIPALIE